MKRFLTLTLLISSVSSYAAEHSIAPLRVTIPYMAVEASHRIYADALLAVALKLSEDKYGPYQIIQQKRSTVIRRQLVDLEKGAVSVALSMPTPEWMERALPVRFPLMKGLSSYRFFLGNRDNHLLFNQVRTLGELKQLSIGQGPGWSTNKILEDNGFNVVYGGPYPTLIPMLEANRFQLLMRSVFEVVPEFNANNKKMPKLMIIENFAVYTYLPMYYFVTKHQPELAERLAYGLIKAHQNGELDKLFNHYFADDLKLLDKDALRIFKIPNTNIDNSFFNADKPYLLNSIVQLETQKSIE